MSRTTRIIAAASLALAVTFPTRGADAKPPDPRIFEPTPLKTGVMLPYPLHNVFRGYSCRKRRRGLHKAIDIGGVGPDWGIGTPIRAMARSRIVRIGTPESNPKRYGRRDTREGTVVRGRKELPRSREIEGYGRVYFFTENYGSARSGVIIVTRVLDGRMRGYTVSYMHLAAVHPSLKVGSVVEAGQEIGLLGGTAVQDDAPHLHLAIKSRGGRILDPGRLLGIGSTWGTCNRRRAERVRKRYTARARKLMAELARERRRLKKLPDVPAKPCADVAIEERVRSPERYHEVRVTAGDQTERWTIRLEATKGRWKPRLSVRDAAGHELHTGAWAPKKLRRRYRFDLDNSGKRKGPAELKMRVPARKTVTIRVEAWRRRDALPSGARYRLEVERTCPEG